MQKTITVRGTGHAKATPDCVHIFFTLVNTHKQYARAMEAASSDIDALKSSLALVGVPPEEIKTAGFSVETDRSFRHGRNCVEGYSIYHKIKIVMDFDKERLGRILEAITHSCAAPDFSIRFTVKDPTAIRNEILETAASNAHAIAEVLCKGSGTGLGELLSIDYSWQEVGFYSRTEIAPSYLEEDHLNDCDAQKFTPDDIQANDTVTFVWAIK